MPDYLDIHQKAQANIGNPFDYSDKIMQYAQLKQQKDQMDHQKILEQKAAEAEQIRAQTQKMTADLAVMAHMVDYAEKSGDINAANSIAEQVGSDIRLTALPQKNKDEKTLKFTIPSSNGAYIVEGTPEDVKGANRDMFQAIQQNPGAVDSRFIATMQQKYPSLVIGNEKEKSGIKIENNMGKVGNASMEELGKKMATSLSESYDNASELANSLPDLQKAENLLNSGMITGFGAGFMVEAGKALQQAGFNFSTEPIANTEAYMALMGNQVATIIKKFGSGTGLSDADREYAQQIVGGKIQATEKSLRRIIDINKRAIKNAVNAHNKKAKQAMKKQGAEELPYNLVIDLPEDTGSKTAEDYLNKFK